MLARMNREDRARFRTARPRAQLMRGRNDWYSIRLQEGDASTPPSAELLIYDEIGYWGITALDLVRDLQALDVDKISARINSPGGEIFDGITIYNALRDHRADVDVTVDGLAASIASVIAMAGDTVTMNRGSTMMIHDGHGIAIGNAEVMREFAAVLDQQSNNVAGIYAARAGGTAEEWRAAMIEESWFTAAEAVEAGLADSVAGDASDSTGAENSWDLSIFASESRSAAPLASILERRRSGDKFTPKSVSDPANGPVAEAEQWRAIANEIVAGGNPPAAENDDPPADPPADADEDGGTETEPSALASGDDLWAALERGFAGVNP